MEHWGPLIQTVLWVSLIAGIAYRFHKPLQALLDALTERIRAGSDITAGPFSVKGMQTLSVPEQAAKADEEIKQASAAAAQTFAAETDEPRLNPTPTPTPSQAAPKPTPQFRARYFQAEDLAIRAVQAEFGQPINRQVGAGPGMQFDGAFVHNNRLNIVEVKYVANPPAGSIVRQVLNQVQSFVFGNKWKSVNLILVVVVDRTSDVDATLNRLTAAADDTTIPTIVRVYALSELQAKFGIVDQG